MATRPLDGVASRTPMRISLVGGGSDLPAFYRRHGGAVLSTAIDQYVEVVVRRRVDRKIELHHHATEIVDDVASLRHALTRETLRALDIAGGISIETRSPFGSYGAGLGGSSAYVVGLVRALHALEGIEVDSARLAADACAIEIERCGFRIGKQDQFIAAHGGFRFIRFHADERVDVARVAIDGAAQREIERRFLLFDTQLRRSSDTILSRQSARIRTDERVRHGLVTLAALAEELRDRLERGDLDAIGPTLHAGWELKRRLAPGVTSPTIDGWYASARRAGALGGKLLGAGGGGFLLLYAPPERHAAIRRELRELRQVKVHLAAPGSEVVLHEPYRA
jgi:D-glycero-alpha-D-manno-heptose-7-phosphate kinase